MQFVEFPEANRQLGAPGGMSSEEVGTLPVYADGRQCISCWQPNEAEREAIAAGQPVYLGVLVSNDPAQPVFTQNPVYLTVGKPDMPAVRHEASPEMMKAFAFIAHLLPDPATIGKGVLYGAALATEAPELRQPDGQPFDPDKLYYLSSVAVQAEHYACLVEAYAQGGQPAVVAYLQPYEAFLPKEVFTQPSN